MRLADMSCYELELACFFFFEYGVKKVRGS